MSRPGDRQNVAVATIRSMEPEDVSGAELAWHEANSAIRAHFHLPPVERSPDSVAHTSDRLAYLQRTDPAGCWVAVDEQSGEVIGIAASFVRDELWVLSLLGVSPDFQGNGTGKALLDAALTSGKECNYGMIMSSRDPRAVRRYLRADFQLHPAVAAWGRVERRNLRRVDSVREGTSRDLEFATQLDRSIRSAAHGPDLEQLIEEGCVFLVAPDQGYVVARESGVVLLAAASEESAAELLHAGLAIAGEGDEVDLSWITGGQQWAMHIALEVGLELHGAGHVMLRGMAQPPAHYLPSGAFG